MSEFEDGQRFGSLCAKTQKLTELVKVEMTDDPGYSFGGPRGTAAVRQELGGILDAQILTDKFFDSIVTLIALCHLWARTSLVKRLQYIGPPLGYLMAVKPLFAKIRAKFILGERLRLKQRLQLIFSRPLLTFIWFLHAGDLSTFPQPFADCLGVDAFLPTDGFDRTIPSGQDLRNN